MKVLVLGGTKFVGRHIVETLLTARHQVTILTRGRSPDELPREVERLHGDRDEGISGLEALSGRTWDACVDVCGYTPLQVRPSAEMLCKCIPQYVFVSTVSVYRDFSIHPIVETHPVHVAAEDVVTSVSPETYGPLKVACEQIVQTWFPGRCSILRPQIIAGPHDKSGRYSYWVQRATQGGEMLVPGNGSDHLQVIDARDLARFVQRSVEKRVVGIFNLAGHRLSWSEFIKLLGPEKPVWVSSDFIESAGLSSHEIPLFCAEHQANKPSESAGIMDVCNDRAVTAGLTLTDPATTINDTRAWLAGREFTPALSPEREAEILRQASKILNG